MSDPLPEYLKLLTDAAAARFAAAEAEMDRRLLGADPTVVDVDDLAAASASLDFADQCERADATIAELFPEG